MNSDATVIHLHNATVKTERLTDFFEKLSREKIVVWTLYSEVIMEIFPKPVCLGYLFWHTLSLALSVWFVNCFDCLKEHVNKIENDQLVASTSLIVRVNVFLIIGFFLSKLVECMVTRWLKSKSFWQEGVCFKVYFCVVNSGLVSFSLPCEIGASCDK